MWTWREWTRWAGLVTVSVFFAAACGGGGDSQEVVTADVAGSDLGAMQILDVGQRDGSSGPSSDGWVKEVFSFEDIEVHEGGLGWPCEANGDCVSGFCLETRDGSVCTENCIENCPDGWACEQSPFTVDVTYICVPKFIHLCDPCERNEDCNGGFDGIDDRCIASGNDGKFCGGDCTHTGLCPAGYVCETIEGAVKQCLPESGVCECSPRAIRLELSTGCSVENEFGACQGERMCAPMGLSDCDAAVPEEEVCDGRDNDCSGVADDFEEPRVCQNSNQYGACDGEEQCVGGVALCHGPEASPEVCDGVDNDCDGLTDETFQDSDADGYMDCIDSDDDNDGILDEVDICPRDYDPEQENYDGDDLGDACDDDDDNDGVNDADDCAPMDAAIKPGIPEICDYRDNDCDGETDEGICDDGNPCTDDFCDPVEGCSHQPNANPCDDGSVCTSNDRCVDGGCTGGTPMNCDDGNPCTDDFCNPSTGCYSANNTAPCEDGSFCTDGDTCRNGSCVSGPRATCDDDNPCTRDTCEPATGCVYDPNVLTGSPCNDGDPCYLGDVCSGGVCTQGPISACAQQNNCPNGIYLGTCLPVGDIPVCIGGCLGDQ